MREAPVVGGVNVPRGNGEIIRMRRGASISDFADKIETITGYTVQPGTLVTILFHLGEMATATESLDEATFEVLGDELGYKIQMVSPEDEDKELLEGFGLDLDAGARGRERGRPRDPSAGRHRHGSRRPR